MIAQVRKAVRIPVIASGDVFSIGNALGTLRETECHAVLVARGALGNPWIFRDLAAAYQRETRRAQGSVCDWEAAAGSPAASLRPAIDEVRAVIRRHLALAVDHYGSPAGIVRFRKCFIWYTRGLKNARLLRPSAVRAASVEEMHDLIDKLEAQPASFTGAPSRGSIIVLKGIEAPL